MSFSGESSDDVFAPQAGGQAAAFDLAIYLQAIRKYYWIPVLTTLIAIGLGLVFVKLTRPMYRSTAELLLENPGTSAVSVSLVDGSTTQEMRPEDIKTLELTFLGPTLMKRVIQKLKLQERDNFVAPGKPAKDVPESDLIGFLQKNSKLSQVPETRLMDVSFTHRDPNVAQEVTNAIVIEGISYDREQRAAAVIANVDYLKEEVKELEANLIASENKLNDYTRTLGSAAIDQDVNIEKDKLDDLNRRAEQAKADRLKLESDFHEIEAIRNDPVKLLGIDSIRTSAGVAPLITKLNELKANFTKLELRYRSGNPFFIQAQSELKKMEQTVEKRALEAAQGMEANLTAARDYDKIVSQNKAEQEAKVLKINFQLGPSNVLKRQKDTDLSSYEVALKRLNEQLSQTRIQSMFLQIAYPAGWGVLVSVKSNKVIAMSVVGGLFVGIGIIALLVRLDTSVQSVAAAEGLLSLSVLAAVPEYKLLTREHHPESSGKGDDPSGRNSGKTESQLVSPVKPREEWMDCPVISDVHSTAAEAFRTLRTSLPDLGGKGGEFILLTSSVAAEGTTFCCLNLGVALAQSGQRTLLVDANLRDPALEEKMFGSGGRYGLSDFLAGGMSYSSVIRATPVENLDVVTAGTTFSHPAEILSRSRLREFLEESRSLYDRIVFDSAPVTLVSDTLCFARYFQVICLVMRSGRTTRNAAKRAVELIERSGVRPVGLIMNFATAESAGGLSFLARVPFEEIPRNVTPHFEVECPTCGTSYETMDEFLAKTSPADLVLDFSSSAKEISTGSNFRIARKCQCGALLTYPSIKGRDTSREGLQRRELFSDLLKDLERSGLPHEDTRTKLLLTLKMWRNENGGNVDGASSLAGLSRRRLFDEMISDLVKGGLTAEAANAKLLQAIQAWRQAP